MSADAYQPKSLSNAPSVSFSVDANPLAEVNSKSYLALSPGA
jgi:hypothetical protein